uniref:PDZ domain-containing protein n=1 Tax=Hippocampus comes TaxID=109280 RepID=A0A3Q2YIJ0_HIPCM
MATEPTNNPSNPAALKEGSSAQLAGLQAGDQVLEIEGHNVSTLCPQAVVAIAQTQKNIPPSIGVVSRIQQVCDKTNTFMDLCDFLFFFPVLCILGLQMDIVPGPDGRYGFTIVGDCPLLVEDCSPCSPAGRAGLRAGDCVMEVNGIPVRQHEMAAALIKSSQGRTLRLGVLGLGTRQKGSLSMEDNRIGGESTRADRKYKALEFNRKVADTPEDLLHLYTLHSFGSLLSHHQVEQILSDEPNVKERLFSVLKQYAAEKNVDWLASVLPEILITDDHRQLISSIR